MSLDGRVIAFSAPARRTYRGAWTMSPVRPSSAHSRPVPVKQHVAAAERQ